MNLQERELISLLSKLRISAILLFVSLLMSIAFVPSVLALAEGENSGPFVDQLVYKILSSQDEEILALQNDEIDVIGSQIDPIYLDMLDEDPHISTVGVVGNGYGQLVINTAKYPLNITPFRRALAFALDKNSIRDYAWAGEAYAIDSPVPAANPFSIEGSLPYNYYSNQSNIGNQLLDDAGFLDHDADGFREAPDGSDFDILIEVPVSSLRDVSVGNRIAAALGSLHIDAQSQPTDYFQYVTRVNFHQDFDMVIIDRLFSDFGVQWLETSFGSTYATVDFYNPSNFRNTTFDSWLPQLLSSTSYADVQGAAEELQKILIYECPVIILYERIDYAAYRTDVFENHIADAIENVHGFWTNLKVRKKEAAGGPFGGIYRSSITQDVDSFNFMVSTNWDTARVLSNTELSLMKRAANGALTPWLMESVIVETNADNSSVPAGYTRFTFDILQNATWSDGHPVDSLDVAFSFNYYLDTLAYGNPVGANLVDLAAAYSTAPYQVVIEFSTESYWHLENIATLNIIPQHVFEAIGVSGWSTWNPILGSDPFITASPFRITGYVSGDYIELTYSDGFFFAPSHDVTSPAVIGPPLVAFPESSTGEIISWNLADDHPDSYEIYKDGGIIESGTWNVTPTNVTISLDGLTVGVYDFTLMAYDTSGNSGSWSVMVLVLDIISPVISHPSDIEFVNGTTGNIISWNATDANPLSYVILVDETEVAGGYWNSSSDIFILNCDDLSAGHYNVTIFVFDLGFNMARDTVWVTVREPSIIQFLMDNVLIVSAIGAIIIVAVVAVIRRR
ncbi:MAG: ABC transporter substrate-binding protein [Candidatus Thorarchaeota archaeon]